MNNMDKEIEKKIRKQSLSFNMKTLSLDLGESILRRIKEDINTNDPSLSDGLHNGNIKINIHYDSVLKGEETQGIVVKMITLPLRRDSMIECISCNEYLVR